MLKHQNRKTIVSAFVLVCSLILSTGCGKKQQYVQGGHASSRQTGVEDLLSSAISSQDTETTESGITPDFVTSPAYTSQALNQTVSESPLAYLTPGPDGIDIDLSTMSADTVYAMVYDMVVNSESYIGKVVKMTGAFATSYDEANGIRYYACIVKDATACCAQGIEFDPGNKYVYPQDFPEDGADCTVVGVFDAYTENGYKYLTLRKAELCTENN